MKSSVCSESSSWWLSVNHQYAPLKVSGGPEGVGPVRLQELFQELLLGSQELYRRGSASANSSPLNISTVRLVTASFPLNLTRTRWFSSCGSSSLPGSCVWKLSSLVHEPPPGRAGPPERPPRWPLTVSWCWTPETSAPLLQEHSESLWAASPPHGLTCISACVYLLSMESIWVWMLCNGWVCPRRWRRHFVVIFI